VIRPLRVRHRRTVGALAVALPLGVAAALSARPPELEAAESGAPPSALTPASLPTAAPMDRVFVRGFGPWAELPLTALLGKDGAGGTQVEFRPTGPLLQPDLMAYWSPGAPDPGAPEPAAAAVLLGRVGEVPCRFGIPAAEGHLILFDLARGEVVAARAIPELVGN